MLKMISPRTRTLIEARQGGAAVELAMIAPLFLLILLITIELCIMLYTQSVLDASARTAARQIRTGQVQSSATPQTAFQNTFCANVSIAISCGSVAMDIESFANFSSMSLPAVQTDKKGNVTNANFAPGGPGSAVAVRVFYTYHFVVPWVSFMLNPNGNGVILQSTVVFQNEPFPTGVGG